MKIDVAAHIGAVERGSRLGERDGEPVRVVTAGRTYATSVEELWDAVTNAERIPRWFLPIEGDLKPGGRYQLQGNAGGEILECQRPTHLAVTWEYAGTVSWLTVRLEAVGADRARLELEHSFREDAHWEQFGPGATGVGWDMGLMGLGEHIASSAPRDPAAAMAWMMSDEGHEFIRRSAGHWQEADGAAGTAAETAAARARQTVAAYTGQSPDEQSAEG
ncbi:MAG TPA: SRPBCC family protein [Longimicrobiales bacterium]|nr:SRPBCC family protein [Longimicrobiales bacterium]